jgi:hypothetical protein
MQPLKALKQKKDKNLKRRAAPRAPPHANRPPHRFRRLPRNTSQPYLHAHLHTSAYVSIRQHTSAYVSVRQRASAYVSIRQHTSAYVSIRQHTSEYVSIRQSKAVKQQKISSKAAGEPASSAAGPQRGNRLSKTAVKQQ